ncbi:MAG: hypothetical protein CM15mP51_05570 [Porticoccaceae bacterium]|nr:MAG: hypothetical protein CM15mP51_05570 [Porticoccaceae bacterium]
MTVINTNVAASITANALTKNERAMSQAMERLSQVSVLTVLETMLRVLRSQVE